MIVKSGHGSPLPIVARYVNMICSATMCNGGDMSNISDAPHERLRRARMRAGYDSAAAFAQAANLKEVSYRAYENGQNGFAKLAPAFGKLLGVTAEWLLEGGVEPNAPPPPRQIAERLPIRAANEGAVQLRVVDLNLAMGDGGNIDDWASDDETIEFDHNLLRTISRAPVERMIVARPSGDSMLPTLMNGDVVVIDTTQRMLNLDDRIWACSVYGAGAVKRLKAVGRNRVEVRSDNPVAGNREVDADDLVIFGRVIWVGRQV